MWITKNVKHNEIIDTEEQKICNLFVEVKYWEDVCVMGSLDGENFLFFSRLKPAEINEIKNMPKYIKFSLIYSQRRKIKIGWYN